MKARYLLLLLCLVVAAATGAWADETDRGVIEQLDAVISREVEAPAEEVEVRLGDGEAALDLGEETELPLDGADENEPGELLPSGGSVLIDAAHFPDAAFRGYVSQQIDTNRNGCLDESENASAEFIDVRDMGIRSLAGIEYFENLTELDCSGNALTRLELGAQPQLYSLLCDSNRLTSLDVRGCERLFLMSCSDNQLTSLRVRGCKNLGNLYCADNRLTTLDITECPELYRLHCEDNRLTKISGLPGTKMTFLYCADNRLSALDIKSCEKLCELDCSGNLLTALTLPNAKWFDELNCSFNRLSALDVSRFDTLNKLNCAHNRITRLTVTCNAYFTTLDCSDNLLSALTIKGGGDLEYLNCAGNRLKALKTGSLSKLKSLLCSENRIANLSVDKCPQLEVLICGSNKLKRLTVKGHSSLRVLDCHDNGIAELDIDSCPSLNAVQCYDNMLRTLDVSTVPGLVDTVLKGGLDRSKARYGLYTHEIGETEYRIAFDYGLVFVTYPPQKPGLTGASETITVGSSFTVIRPDSRVQPPVCKFKSSNEKVATVNYAGEVRGISKGTATITAEDRGVTSTCRVTVKKSSARVKLSGDTLKLGAGEKAKLQASLYGAGVDGVKLAWTSSNEAVASVNQKGVVTALKPGLARITVSAGNGRKDSCAVSVKKAPSSVSLNKKKLTLTVGQAFALKATPSKGAYSSVYTWSCSDESVVSLSGSGEVTALKPGNARVTVKAFNGQAATCSVTVKNTTVYRALLIGQEDFSYGGDAFGRDVREMKKTLRSVKGPEGGAYNVFTKYNLSARDVLFWIDNVFKFADDDDVSLFYIATHGDHDRYSETAGALSMLPGGTDSLRLWELAEALKAVPGRVIVIIDSCGSGAAVYKEGAAQNGTDAMKAAAEAFDAAVVSAFADSDPGVIVNESGRVVPERAVWGNTGWFRKENKFYVLTASRYREMSYFDQSLSFFTKWLTQGVGTEGGMPADKNKNGTTSLTELFDYICKKQDTDWIVDRFVRYYQHAQVYPKNSTYGLFKRK